ncbi:Uncharacterised protein [Serratia rubidaea]|uniref:Uncharacterized protein n=1 Tax=Serratia rubidaea TaxID=61652 RepID=A0A4V6JIL5_SERRU|nr:Uncharacterised protein [Serratia rubidaea]
MAILEAGNININVYHYLGMLLFCQQSYQGFPSA